ncbi:MAG: ASCH domain-containing protein [Treponema sp.]|nr:ASCH domain-containing protein [Treponema sp.]
MTDLDEYWEKFLIETNRSLDEKCAGDLSFEAKGFAGDELITLVLSGKKTAIFSSFSTFAIDGEPLPVSGELYIVLDRANNPRCVIELTSVNVIPYNEVTWEMAKQEGEDESLQAWKEKQQDYLEEEGALVGFDFNPGIKLVFQCFRVVYQ